MQCQWLLLESPVVLLSLHASDVSLRRNAPGAYDDHSPPP
uniref:Uncharacterized protein n=2 Tax=Picea TaxID=3328 RepID=A0A117NIS1_PICGL|nr:hypothetical protein ABT39_MTgene221 [Picea glauca]QHR90097.1 hypothetical protein Q903MT_gene4120 [Picea sitchensis]